MSKGAVQRTIWQNAREWFARPASTPESAAKYLENTIPKHNIMTTMRETACSISDLITSPFVHGANVIGKTVGMAVRAPFAIPSAIGWGVSNLLVTLGVPLQMIAAASDNIGHKLEQGPATTVPNRINTMHTNFRTRMQRLFGLEEGAAPAPVIA